jgi:hypothetical protein
MTMMIKRERENDPTRNNWKAGKFWSEAKSDQDFWPRLDFEAGAVKKAKRCHLPDMPCEVRVFPPRRCQGWGSGRAEWMSQQILLAIVS